MNLRAAIAGVALILFLLIASAAIVEPAARPPAVMMGLLLAAILFENRRYRMSRDMPRDGLTPTKERFVDPESGKTTRVWISPAGERQYLDD